MEKKKAKSGKKNRKFGKNASYCKYYKDAGVELKNKRWKMARHIRRFPENLQAVRDFDRLFGKLSSVGVLDGRTHGQVQRAAWRIQRNTRRKGFGAYRSA